MSTTAPLPAPPKIYRAGTLRYTLSGLVVLFCWLLWGDFCFTFFEAVFGRFLPLYLKEIEASNTLIGILTGSIAGLVNVLFLPNISQWSDRYRSPMGRRIPFLYVSTPLTAFSLIGLGLAPEIAAWLHAHPLPFLAPSVTVGAVIVALLCVFAFSFHFFNMVLVASYNWLFRDVVPLELMARFLSWFRIVGTVSSFAFLWWVFPHILTHRKTVFLGVAAFYLVFYLLMCRNVKEGAYPPPEIVESPGLVKAFLLYFRDCLSVPLYRHFFLAYILAVSAIACAGPFTILFSRETLGLSMDDMGKVFAWGAAASALAYFSMGWLCDRVSPILVGFFSLLGLLLGSVLACLLVREKAGYLVYTVLYAIPMVSWNLGWSTTAMRLFPETRFGQFSSGLNVFGCGLLIPSNYLIGQFMDLVHSDYRMSFLWSALLFALALYPMFLVYRGWKRHGGPGDYVPPLPPS